MKTKWDYTELAQAYLKRPDYSSSAIQDILKLTQTSEGANVCDVGAGVAHLTLHLARHGFQVMAVEPNDAMRELGIQRTREFDNVQWFEGTGEKTGQADTQFELVTFGSSFNVCDREKALLETDRIIKPGGWFACMWNHRNLDDPIQEKIESIIKSHIDAYDYGSRREDQSEVIKASGLFHDVHKVEGTVQHQQTLEECITAWKSHGTLHRQAGDKFQQIVTEIETYLNSLNQNVIDIPYTTRVWVAQSKK